MKKIGVASLVLVFFVGVLPVAVANSGGAPPRTSGGEFPGEQSCVRCHTGTALNAGRGTLELRMGDSPAAGQTYTPGEMVSLIVSFEDPDVYRIGFQLTVRSGDGCGPAGSLAAAPTPDGSGIKVVTGNCGTGSDNIEWATQQRPRNESTTDFEIAWTAPPASVGPITVAVAVNGADGSLNTQGDKIYAAQATLEPQAALGPPMISEGGVTLFGAAEAIPKGAPGSIAAVVGTDFAAAGSETAGSVDANGDLGTAVNGVCVEVGQTRAPVLHVAADQILFQVPANAAVGPVPVQVIRECDSPAGGPPAVHSNTATFTVGSVQPVLLQFSDTIEGLAALHTDLAVVAAEDAFAPPADAPQPPAGSEPAPGPAARPAVPGDIVTLFGTGFGAVDPPLRTGELPDLPRALAASSIKPMIGEFEIPASDITYVGASPEIAGLYQISARIPAAVPAGNHPFSLDLDGIVSPVGPGLVIDAMPPDPGEPDGSACKAGLVVKPGETCSGVLQGTLGTYPGEFTVKESGEACLLVTGGSLKGLELCEQQAHNPLGANLFIATRGDDNSWTITKYGADPEP